MLQPAQTQPTPKPPATPANYTPVRTVSPPMEQATIGRSLVIKGEVTGSECLYIDGRVEGTINIADDRVTIGRNGSVVANIDAKEVVIMGSVKGNIQCSDRLDIRSEGSLIGDVVSQRISVEDGALVKGSVKVHTAQPKSGTTEQPKAAAAAA